MNEKALTPHAGEVLIYKTDDGKLKLDVRLEEEPFGWRRPIWRSVPSQASEHHHAFEKYLSRR